MKRVLFIGNRAGVFRELSACAALELTSLYAVRGSHLAEAAGAATVKARVFGSSEKAAVLAELAQAEFDLLISNGCPFVLPVSKMRRPGHLFLNIHPGPLPDGKGRHPINGAVLLQQRHIGATLHYMDDGIDTGAIVHQETVALTDDLDLGLLYHLAFELEARVFCAGLQKLIAADFRYPGQAQPAGGWFYSRRPEDQVLDLATMPDEEVLRRIRAFGIPSQGVLAQTSAGRLRLFEAEPIYNSFLREKYAGARPGTVVREYDSKLLLKTSGGLIKVRAYECLKDAW